VRDVAGVVLREEPPNKLRQLSTHRCAAEARQRQVVGNERLTVIIAELRVVEDKGVY
jgi:hypothetical protein